MLFSKVMQFALLVSLPICLSMEFTYMVYVVFDVLESTGSCRGCRGRKGCRWCPECRGCTRCGRCRGCTDEHGSDDERQDELLGVFNGVDIWHHQTQWRTRQLHRWYISKISDVYANYSICEVKKSKIVYYPVLWHQIYCKVEKFCIVLNVDSLELNLAQQYSLCFPGRNGEWSTMQKYPPGGLPWLPGPVQGRLLRIFCDTDWARLIWSHSSARIYFKISGNTN